MNLLDRLKEQSDRDAAEHCPAEIVALQREAIAEIERLQNICEAIAEIERLQNILTSVHDRILRGDSDAELMALCMAGWEKTK
jgi:hypothetical protein